MVHGNIPLSGPTTLTGQPLGPLFYYFLFPAFVLTGHPLGVVIWQTIVTTSAVMVLYALLKKVSDPWVSRLVSGVWVLSSGLIAIDRSIWEPNLVPLFVLVHWMILWMAVTSHRSLSWFGVGMSLGVLLQLHYPTLLFVPLTLLLLVLSLIRGRSFISVVKNGLWCIGGLLLLMLPFLYDEFGKSFRDLTDIITMFSHAGTAAVGKRVVIAHMADYGVRVLSFFYPFLSLSSASFLFVLWGIFVLMNPTGIALYLSAVVALGLFGMAKYEGVVYDHYLFFLAPAPFLMAAVVLGKYKTGIGRWIGLLILGGILCFHVVRLPAVYRATDDVDRTFEASRLLVRLAKGEPFSFTLFRSRSFSDLQYRYALSSFGYTPKALLDQEYSQLFLVCDSDTCPSVGELTDQDQFPSICSEPHCKGEYPILHLKRDWQYMSEYAVFVQGKKKATVYSFLRRKR